MQAMQAVVVRWMARQLQRLHWSAERWAREAKLAPTTVTRAMSSNYKSVSSVSTLCALARAAGVPTILDFLDGQTDMTPRSPIIAAILKELLPAIGCGLPDDKLGLLSDAMASTFAGLAQQDGEGSTDPVLASKLARAARVIIQHN